ncbi:MAG: SagB/ThcOx family dehydrogenase [candidate division Zixibacteria bacterium]|nr:SagB/ThcOx family dehydrogenase [candidate division Zixibacteria bacterium]
MPDMRTYRRFLSADTWEEFTSENHPTDQRRKISAPPIQKPYPADAQLIDLIAPEQIRIGTAPFRDVIIKRKSRRKFSSSPLTLEELSFLLWATQGIRRVTSQDGQPLRSFRTVPSGGGRHALETYLVINRVAGIEPGLYRYLPIEHKLLFLNSRPDLAKELAHACLEQTYIKEGAVVFAWTTIPYRAEWRYSIVSHKMIALDAGHVCQNLYLAAEAIGAGTCAIGAYHQKPVDDLINVDGEDEFVIYLAPVGKQA